LPLTDYHTTANSVNAGNKAAADAQHGEHSSSAYHMYHMEGPDTRLSPDAMKQVRHICILKAQE